VIDPSCPSCELPISAAAFASGTCPCCDHRFDAPPAVPETARAEFPTVGQPLAVSPPLGKRRNVWVPVAATVSALVVGISTGYFLYSRTEEPSLATGIVERIVKPPASVLTAGNGVTAPTSSTVPLLVPMPASKEILPQPHAVALAPEAKTPEKAILIDPADNADLKLDAPMGTAELVPLDGDDRITLSGRVKILKVNSVNGSIQLDASRLVAEEIVLDGDVNGNCRLKLNSAGGRVTIRGAFVGSSTLAVTAPGGTVILAEGGRIGGGTTVTVTAKAVESKGLINEGAKVNATLDSGGAIRVASLDGGASVTYRRAGAGDPKPKVETGELRSGTRVIEAK
jgi:hypothetical protein